MNKLPKIKDNDLQEHELALARYLIQYHRHAFDVRSTDLLMATVDPPEVRELVNILLWLGNGFTLTSVAEHAIGLEEVINSSAKEMEALISYIREQGAMAPQVKEINFLQEQMEAADTLMGYLIDGR